MSGNGDSFGASVGSSVSILDPAAARGMRRGWRPFRVGAL